MMEINKIKAEIRELNDHEKELRSKQFSFSGDDKGLLAVYCEMVDLESLRREKFAELRRLLREKAEKNPAQ